MNLHSMTTRRTSFLAVATLLALTVRAGAESARDELLRLVPDDVGFCLVLEDLRGHVAQLTESPFLQQFQKSPMGALLDADRDMRKFIEGRQQLETLFGVDWPKLRDEILGDAVVFAFRPAPPDKSGQDQALILLRARDPQALANLVERINAFQKTIGEVKAVEPRTHKGQKYFERVEAKALPFYALAGPVLALSSHDAMLRQALDRRGPDATAEPLLAGRLRQLLGPERRLASLWLNPRAFDAAISAKAKEGSDEKKAVLKNFSTYWRALDGVAGGIGVNEDVTCTLAIGARVEQLSPAARRFLAEAAKPSELWQHFPDDALLAFAGRFDPAAFEQVLGEFLTPQARQVLHDSLDRFVGAALDKDVVKDVLPFLGPDIGLCVMAPEEKAKSWVPQAFAALRVRPGDKPPFVDQTAFAAVKMLAQAAVIDHNSKHVDRLRLKTEMQDKVEVSYLDGAAKLPPGVRPAFALKDGYLVLATSPNVLRRFGTTVDRPPAADVPLLRVSLAQWRAYVQVHRQALAAALAEQNKAKPEEVAHQVDALLEGLRLFDRLEISQRSGDGRTALTLRVRMALPLRK
jgi:hypothetical protein